MMRKSQLALVIGLATAAVAAIAYAQPGLVIKPNRPSSVHEVTVANGMGFPIRLRTVGFRRDASFTTDLGVRDSQTHRFYSGERVVTVWGQDGQLIFAAVVPFNRSGTLVIREPGRPRPPGGPRPRPVEAAHSGLPRIGIE